jgi:hypothetical protein
MERFMELSSLERAFWWPDGPHAARRSAGGPVVRRMQLGDLLVLVDEDGELAERWTDLDE